MTMQDALNKAVAGGYHVQGSDGRIVKIFELAFPLAVTPLVTNGVSRLQTELSHREGHEARRIGLEAMPVDQHIEGRHTEREPGVEIRPHAVHDPLEMADQRQHREHRLDQHAVLPRATLTHFEIARIPLRGMETGVA